MRATLGIGVLGTGWRAKAHTHALRALSTTLELPFDIRLVSLGRRAADGAAETTHRSAFHYEYAPKGPCGSAPDMTKPSVP